MDLDNSQMGGGSADYEGHVSHTAQAAPITVQWLIDNFEPAEGCSLRRSTLYNYYLHHCEEQKIEPVNPASFGKLIRSVFLGLRTRRLGTRGNSKYHYYGIRVKISSPLNQIDEQSLAMRNHPMSLSPTGSPSNTPTQATTIVTVTNHHQNGGGVSTPKRAKNNSSFNNNNQNSMYNDPQSTHTTPVVEYKPIITNIINGNEHHTHYNNNNSHYNNNQNTLLQPSNNHLNNQILTPVTPQTTNNAQLMTVILSNNPSSNNQNSNPNSIQNVQKSSSSMPVQVVPNITTTMPKPTNIIKLQPSNVINQLPVVQQQQQQQQQHDLKAANQFIDANEAQKQQQQQQMIENCDSSSANPSFMPTFCTINLENITLPPDCTLNDVKKFEDLYNFHCKKILEQIMDLKSNQIESIWQQFWRSPSFISTASNTMSFYEESLSTQKFMLLCELDQIVDYVRAFDFGFYQFCVEILIPDVFGQLPSQLVTAIRNLGKSVENWMRNSLQNSQIPDRMRQAKLNIIGTFSMTLRRYTSLNHLAQTVKNSLQNESFLIQMLNDINKVDFNYIREQAKWTCGCDERLINQFEQEFKDSLRNHSQWSMVNWIVWLDTSVSMHLQQFQGTQNYVKQAKQFLLKWSFLCSSVVRDLTLRSAPSFGSFHLIRLLYDEYMYYLIEHKIAEEYKITPIATMSTFDLSSIVGLHQQTSSNNSNDPVSTTSNTTSNI